MNLDGEFQLSAAREKVWEALNDTDVLKECIPGCEELDKLSETQFAALVRAKVGPVNAKFKTEIELQDVKPPESYSLVAKSKGGAAGMGEGVARVQLNETGEGTELNYSVDFKVQGKLAQIGSRLLMNVIQKMSNEFFSKFASNFPSEVQAEPEPELPPGKDEPADRSFNPVWVAAGVLAAGLGYWFLAA